MTLDLEAKWVAAIDSDVWRRLGRSSAGRRFFHSRPYRAADTSRRFVQSALRRRREPGAFASVQTFFLFIGAVKSGGTLIGSLLDAHPDVVCSDEADPLRYVASGFDRDQIFHLLGKTSRREAMKGRITARRLEPYSLAVPGTSQGRFTRPLAIGDSKAGPTTRRLGAQPELLERLTAVLGDIELRCIHVIRHPRDPISAMVLRGRREMPAAIADFTEQCGRVEVLRHRISPEQLFTVRYEEFVRTPRGHLREICRFLGVQADDDYLAACAAVVDPARRQERHAVPWSAADRHAVTQTMRQFSFLRSYIRGR